MKTKKTYYIIIFICLLFFNLNISAKENEKINFSPNIYNSNQSDIPKIENLDPEANFGTLFTSRKDPFLAGFYSFFMMGTGHFYTGEYQKGTLFLFSDLMLKAILVGMLLHFKSEYTTDANDSYQWRDLDVGDRAFILGYSIAYIIILVLNITDAIQSAHRYNRRYIRKDSFSFNFYMGDEQFVLALSKKF